MKFGALLGRARHLYDCEAVATGHYARRDGRRRTGRARLLRARDADKDQTYFLYGLRQDQLEHARFPLGELTKPEVRAVARGARPGHRRQAREPGDLLRARRRLPRRAARAGRLAARGRARSSTPTASGWGSTAARPGYTVGQRQGLGVALGEPRYVSRIDPLTNTITLGRREDLETTTVALERTHVRRRRARRPGARRPFRADVRIRHRADAGAGDRPPATGRRAGAGGDWIVETDAPVWAAAPGPGRRPVRRRASCSVAVGSLARRRRRDRPRPSRSAPARSRSPVSIGPAIVLAILVGIFNAALYVLIRGNAGGRLPIIVVAAILGAWAGDALGDRLGFDVLRIGDFHLVAASIVAWVGIGISSAVAILGPSEHRA